MPKKKCLVLALFAFMTLCAVNAQTILIAIAQNSAAPVSAVTMSKTVEDELLGLLFERGIIVSSAELALSDDGYDTPNFGIKDAAFGMSDYLIAIRLTYGAEEKKLADGLQTYAQLLSLDWKLVRVINPVVLSSGSMKTENGPIVDNDPYRESRLVLDAAYPSIDNALREATKGGKR